jgi:ATP/ADP translocase
LILENKFLLFLTLVVCFERTTPDMVQFLYQEALKNLATGRDAIVALDANLERWRGIAEVGVELFLVAAVIRKFGSGICLASNGIAIVGSLIAFAVFANPLVIVAIFHADEAMRHSWFKSAKELTYTVTSRQVLYTLKPFIEMFCYRFSRGFAGLLIFLVYSVMGFGTNGIIVMGVVTGALWAYCGWQLSIEYKRRDALARMLEPTPELAPSSTAVEPDKELTSKA